MNSLANTGTLGNPSVSDDVKTSPHESDLELWTTERVAKYLHVSLKTVFNLRKKGLPYVQLGGAVRFFRRKSGITSSTVVACHRTGCGKSCEKVVPDDYATVHAT